MTQQNKTVSVTLTLSELGTLLGALVVASATSGRDVDDLRKKLRDAARAAMASSEGSQTAQVA